MNYNQSVLNHQIGILQNFLCHYSSYRYLHKEKDKLNTLGCTNFWAYTIDAHYFQSLNLWCMVFGTYSNETHWKKLGLECDLKQLILSKLEFSDDDYTQYHDSLVEWRNKYSAHREPGFLKETPDLKIARNIVFIFFDWVVSNTDITDSFSWEQFEENYKQNLELWINTMHTLQNNHNT